MNPRIALVLVALTCCMVSRQELTQAPPRTLNDIPYKNSKYRPDRNKKGKRR